MRAGIDGTVTAGFVLAIIWSIKQIAQRPYDPATAHARYDNRAACCCKWCAVCGACSVCSVCGMCDACVQRVWSVRRVQRISLESSQRAACIAQHVSCSFADCMVRRTGGSAPTNAEYPSSVPAAPVQA